MLQLCVIAAGPGGTYQLWRGRQRERAATRQVQVIIDPTNVALPFPPKWDFSSKQPNRLAKPVKSCWPQLIIRPSVVICLQCPCVLSLPSQGHTLRLVPLQKKRIWKIILFRSISAKPCSQWNLIEQQTATRSRGKPSTIQRPKWNNCAPYSKTLARRIKVHFHLGRFWWRCRRFGRQQLSPSFDSGREAIHRSSHLTNYYVSLFCAPPKGGRTKKRPTDRRHSHCSLSNTGFFLFVVVAVARLV